MSDEGLDIDLARCNHVDRRRPRVAVAEHATNVDFADGRIHNGQVGHLLAEADQEQATAGFGAIDSGLHSFVFGFISKPHLNAWLGTSALNCNVGHAAQLLLGKFGDVLGRHVGRHEDNVIGTALHCLVGTPLDHVGHDNARGTHRLGCQE